MNHDINNMLQDASLVARLRSVASVAEAAAMLAEAAAARGFQLGRDAAIAFLSTKPARPRELASDELLAVGGGLRAATWGAACGNSTYGHTCCWSCYRG